MIISVNLKLTSYNYTSRVIKLLFRLSYQKLILNIYKKISYSYYILYIKEENQFLKDKFNHELLRLPKYFLISTPKDCISIIFFKLNVIFFIICLSSGILYL